MIAEVDSSTIPISMVEVRLIFGSLVGGVLTLFGYFYNRSLKCEARHDQLEAEVRDLKGKLGFLSGIAEIIGNCSTNGCSFKGKIPTYSLAQMRRSKTGTQENPQ